MGEDVRRPRTGNRSKLRLLLAVAIANSPYGLLGGKEPEALVPVERRSAERFFPSLQTMTSRSTIHSDKLGGAFPEAVTVS